MLVFLVLCTFIGTLQGAPLLPHHIPSSVTTVDLVVREAAAAPDCGGPQVRTVNSILQNCLLTIFVCVWTSAHPNIDGPRDSGWTCFKRKVVTMLCAVIAPEMVLYWALGQRSAAKEIAKKYNKEFARTGVLETSLCQWRKIVGWFKRLPKTTTRRGDGQPWSVTHGFFIQMGGFILYENEYPKKILDYELLAELLRNKHIDAPTVTERDLQDRSKGDTISKTIVVLQTVWFVFQCSARWAQGLPLSELEVLTFAFAVVNVAIYAAWWEKLQDVDMAICVPLKKVENGEVQHVSFPEPASLSLRHSNDDLFLIRAHEDKPNDSAGEKQCWMRRMVRKDREGSLCFPLFLPYRIFGSVIRLLVKMGDVKFGGVIKENDLRVPMFYASSWNGNHPKQALCVVGTIFGAIHLVAWASKSTSPNELVLWRASAILLTIVPSLTLLGWTANTLGMEPIADSVYWVLLLLVPGYIASRFILVIVAILTILHPSPSVLLDISWTLYVPHF